MNLRIFITSGFLLLSTIPGWSDDATKEDYEERLDKYDLVAEPEKHRSVASWCKRNYPTRYSFHQREYHKHQFLEFEGKMGSSPSTSDLKKARDFAEKLELPDIAKSYHTKWGEVQYAAYAKRLKPGNPKMMKQLLAWAVKEDLSSIPSVKTLAGSIIEADSDDLTAREILGHLKVDGQWTSKENLISKMDPKNIEDRIKTHKILAKNRILKERSYSSRPLSGMEELGDFYQFSPRKYPDSKFYLSEKNYSRTKPCRLIISLHGGGSGGFQKASEQAGIAIKSWASANTNEGQIVIAPIATKHVVSSWSTLSNVLEIIDAAEEICERFNIDRKRIYLTGQSMGGGGTCFWYLCFPELAAASVGRTGWFHHDNNKHQDCLSKPILLIQGEKDEAFRIESKDKFMALAKKVNANASVITHPDIGHALYWKDQEEDVLNFMAKHVNDIEPDWDVIRAAAKAWMK
ncbi:MAG: dienelactone hydrolase [Akkermansiaceae bacterium]|jgi:dienelactone hydrolase